MQAERARPGRARRRFLDVRRVSETGSTNADVLAMAQAGEAEGVVLVADHQTSGRGRQRRTWQAPPGSSLLMSVLLRPPTPVIGATTMAMAVAAAEAVQVVTGVSPGLKWPNDLVLVGAGGVGGEGSGEAPHDRPGRSVGADAKLAGILAEVEWPAASSPGAGWAVGRGHERAAVVVGLGLNVNWPWELPDELAGTATALNHHADRPIDREVLLEELLQRLDHHYAELLAEGATALTAEWRRRSATLGRRVRVDLGPGDVTGTAVDVTTEGHLVVLTDVGDRRTFAVGDVVHLRPI